VNMFRLQAFIANETGLFGGRRKSKTTGGPLTIPQLGKFVALCMRWPDFVMDAIEDPELVQQLESAGVDEFTPGRARPILSGRLAFWFEDRGLMKVLKFGGYVEESGFEYSLRDVDFALLSEIAPPRPKSTAELAQEQDVVAAARGNATSAPRADPVGSDRASPQPTSASKGAPQRRISSSYPNEAPKKYQETPSAPKRATKK
jgi:hypothetical protein